MLAQITLFRVLVLALLLLIATLIALRLGYVPPFWLEPVDTERRVGAPIDDLANAEQVADFKAFLFDNDIQHFGARELLHPGGAHFSPTRQGYGLNRLPPKRIWHDMLPTLKVLEKLRTEFGKPLKINSGYRAPAYNRAVGGASRSQHVRFRAFDVAPVSGGASEVKRLYELARKLRDEEEFFVGGIGKYAAWVHIDTRSRNANW